MPLDHYVSQVHLKQFYDPKLGERMHAVQKSNLNTYCCDSESQCRIEDWSTVPLLAKPRLIEDILKHIEPNYNKALHDLRNKKPTRDAVFTIAGFAAYVASVSPTGVRIYSKPIEGTIMATAGALEHAGKLPELPKYVGSESFYEMLEGGEIRIKVNPEYTKSLAIKCMFDCISTWGNSRWDIIINNNPTCPFFTSDYPIAIECPQDSPINKIIPLAPDLAVRIIPEYYDDSRGIDVDFKDFKYRYLELPRPKILDINRLIVRCAEKTVYYRDDKPWVLPFIKKNKNYRIEPYNQRIPTPDGEIVMFSSSIAPIKT